MYGGRWQPPHPHITPSPVAVVLVGGWCSVGEEKTKRWEGNVPVIGEEIERTKKNGSPFFI
jgi:hypothetical protein